MQEGQLNSWSKFWLVACRCYTDWAYHILGNAGDAEDAVQDALLAVYTHLHQFRGQARISTLADY